MPNDNISAERESVPSILAYLNDTLDSLETLVYRIKDTYDWDEIFDNLDEDLPPSRFTEGRRQFIADVTSLGSSFFDATRSKNIRFQVEIVKSDMCRLFHVDNMRQRLLCTYIGPGTEWLDHSNAMRSGLGRGCNTKIVKDFDKVNHAKPFQVVLLKGKLHEDDPGVVHRSPPIQGEAITRVLLKIDESSPEEERY